MSKLTKHVPFKEEGKRKIVSYSEARFIISFSNKLQKKYRFTDLEKSDLKGLQNFFDIASQLTVKEMDERYKRKSDPNDKFNDEPIIHYGTNDSFRIHGMYIEGRFEVLRIDPHHKVHD